MQVLSHIVDRLSTWWTVFVNTIYSYTFWPFLYMESYGSVSHPVQLISVINDLVEISPAAYINPS